MYAAGHEPGEVGHVGQQHGTHRIGDGPKAGEVDHARVGRAATDDELGPVLVRETLDLT